MMPAGQKIAFVLIALVGWAVMTAGVFMPLVGDYERFTENALFDFEDFKGGGDALRNLRLGLVANELGVFMLIIVVLSLVPALTLRGLGVMSFIALVYVSLVLFMIVDLSDRKLSFGWAALYGGVGLMLVAWGLSIFAGRGRSQPAPANYAAYYPPQRPPWG